MNHEDHIELLCERVDMINEKIALLKRINELETHNRALYNNGIKLEKENKFLKEQSAKEFTRMNSTIRSQAREIMTLQRSIRGE